MATSKQYEICCSCGNRTGRAGKGEDSLYSYSDGRGPFCEDCFSDLHSTEGSICPKCDGTLVYPPVKDCSCHINPPCAACTDSRLTCDKCGWERPDATQPEEASVPIKPYEPFKGWEYKLSGGRRLHSVFYDGSSGSTMEFRGHIEGVVTEQEIFECLGDGTFGHRGPTIFRDSFTYTKITD